MADYKYMGRLSKHDEQHMTDAQIRQYYSKWTYDILDKMLDEFTEKIKEVRKEAENIMEASGLRYPILYGTFFDSPIIEDIPLSSHADMLDFMVDTAEIIEEYEYDSKRRMSILMPSIYIYPRFRLTGENIGYLRGLYNNTTSYNIDIWNEEREIGRITISPMELASKVITLIEKVDDDTVAVIREFTERLPTKDKTITEIVEEFNGGA